MLNSSWRVQLKNVARVQKNKFQLKYKNIYCHYIGLVCLVKPVNFEEFGFR